MNRRNALIWTAGLLLCVLFIWFITPRGPGEGPSHLIVNYLVIFVWLAGCGTILMVTNFFSKFFKKK